MKYLLMMIALLTLESGQPIQRGGQWIISSDSQLLIRGQTNVNSFTCFISCYNNVDTLNYTYTLDELKFKKNMMIIPVYNFNCGNNLITKDFRQTVKGDEYPYLNIAFVSLSKENDNQRSAAKMKITLAGVTRNVEVQLDKKTKGDYLQLTGSHLLRFDDFKLTAPERMFGMIKVQQELTVEFNLMIQPI